MISKRAMALHRAAILATTIGQPILPSWEDDAIDACTISCAKATMPQVLYWNILRHIVAVAHIIAKIAELFTRQAGINITTIDWLLAVTCHLTVGEYRRHGDGDNSYVTWWCRIITAGQAPENENNKFFLTR